MYLRVAGFHSVLSNLQLVFNEGQLSWHLNKICNVSVSVKHTNIIVLFYSPSHYFLRTWLETSMSFTSYIVIFSPTMLKFFATHFRSLLNVFLVYSFIILITCLAFLIYYFLTFMEHLFLFLITFQLCLFCDFIL